MQGFKKIVVELLTTKLGYDQRLIEEVLEKPQNPEHGQLSLPCFAWAKTLKKAPQIIAQDLCETLNQSATLDENIQSITALGPYINFKQNQKLLAESLIQSILTEQLKYGQKHSETPKTVVLEFSSPNIAKPLSIGHLRGTNIGACLSRVYKHQGWKVTRINHLGDWGTQFGKVMLAFRLWGNAEDLEKQPIEALYKLYVKFHEEEKNNPSFAQEARDWFAKLENGNETAHELWSWFRDISIKELNKIYLELGVEFDLYWGESFYIDMIGELIQALQDQKLLQNSQDAKIVDLKNHDLGVSVIQKKDESSLYMTRDLAAARYRYKQFDFDEMLYVVGNPQKLHFQQLFKILELLGHDFVKNCQHVDFGHVSFGDEKMSTRKGNIILLKDVLNQAKEKALKIIKEKKSALSNKEEVAQAVGIGAVLFADLSCRRSRDMKFTWDEIFNFEGETGPYLQYGYVRANAILEKYQGDFIQKPSIAHIESAEEEKLISLLNEFKEVLNKTMQEKEPFFLAQFSIELVKSFNRFYAKCRILDASSSELIYFRICLVKSVTLVLHASLKLLGIPIVEKM